MKRALLITAVLAALAAGGVAARAVSPWPGSAAESGTQTRLPPAIAEVTRTTLVQTKTLTGTLGYGAPVPVDAIGEGTLTWMALVGSTVKRGEPLFKIDQLPVFALYGAVPLYRPLREGVVGVDVKQLEENLSRLGYRGFTVDDTFTAGTAAAVRSWQAKGGLVTGTIEPGQVVFTPGPIRIAAHVARVGAPAGRADGGGATVLSYTRKTRLVTVDLEVADQALAAQGGKVTVTIPGGKRVRGRITKVGTVATAPGEAIEGPPGDATSVAAEARIAVTVSIADQTALGSLEAAPVDVDFASQRREGVLTVPVAALLALPAGGYGIEIVEGSTTRILAVKPGLFAAGRVEIRGDGIKEGMKVGMPK